MNDSYAGVRELQDPGPWQVLCGPPRQGEAAELTRVWMPFAIDVHGKLIFMDTHRNFWCQSVLAICIFKLVPQQHCIENNLEILMA